jgi:hypothetical protein
MRWSSPEPIFISADMDIGALPLFAAAEPDVWQLERVWFNKQNTSHVEAETEVEATRRHRSVTKDLLKPYIGNTTVISIGDSDYIAIETNRNFGSLNSSKYIQRSKINTAR